VLQSITDELGYLFNHVTHYAPIHSNVVSQFSVVQLHDILSESTILPAHSRN